MKLSDYRRNQLERYWREMAERHKTVAAMAKEAGVTPGYVYTQLARFAVDTPRERGA